MSGFVAEPVRSEDKKLATAREDQPLISHDQGHDRLLRNAGKGTPPPMADDGSLPEVDISAGQKMLSAVSGSLLTSLLGKEESKSDLWHAADWFDF
jgi:solute carrier family 25 protein 39/40